MGVKHTVPPGGQLSTVAFTVLEQAYGPQAKETEMDIALLKMIGDGRALAFWKGRDHHPGQQVSWP